MRESFLKCSHVAFEGHVCSVVSNFLQPHGLPRKQVAILEWVAISIFRDIPTPGILHWQVDSLLLESPGKLCFLGKLQALTLLSKNDKVKSK